MIEDKFMRVLLMFDVPTKSKKEQKLASKFRNNLIMVDSLMPQICAEILLEYYNVSGQESKSIRELTCAITKRNPLNYDLRCHHNYYERKMKNFLTDVALGMTPKTVWNGKYDANGGYIVVKADGDLLCYHFYDRNLFEEYLYANTRLDTPSTTKFQFAQIVRQDDGALILKLNFQIRFV